MFLFVLVLGNIFHLDVFDLACLLLHISRNQRRIHFPRGCRLRSLGDKGTVWSITTLRQGNVSRSLIRRGALRLGSRRLRSGKDV